MEYHQLENSHFFHTTSFSISRHMYSYSCFIIDEFSSYVTLEIICKTTKTYRSRGSSVSLTTDWTTGVRSPTEAEDFSFSLYVQTGSGAHPASYPMGTGGPFPGGKAWPGRDADHSPPSSAEVKYE
jgi:hypothetical protein